jgi:ABC-2 type transport system ATP-binding protein
MCVRSPIRRQATQLRCCPTDLRAAAGDIVARMLKAHNLGRRFGDTWALRALDLDVAAGEIQCLLGANGAGKTTTINLFLGFLEPSCGAAFVNGTEVARDPRAARAQLAYVPEQVSLYPTLTGIENLDYFTKLAGRATGDASRLEALLDRVELARAAAHSPIERYSKGMRQKVGLAIALAKDARALLLDEPLSGLDPQAANEFCALLQKLAGAGVAVLMATHDLFRAKEIATRIGIMKAGRLLDNLAAIDVSGSQLERIYLDHMHDGARSTGSKA